ncbi:MAG: hypothetical protein AAF614_37825 [Chloroflexota bacterium]
MSSKNFNFNSAAIWVGRLAQLVRAADEWFRISQGELSFSVKKEGQEGLSAILQKRRLEFRQMMALQRATRHLRDFARVIVSRYTVGMLPPKRDSKPETIADIHLLRTMLAHLSTDLSLIQMAQSQRHTMLPRLQLLPAQQYQNALQRIGTKQLNKSSRQKARKGMLDALQGELLNHRGRSRRAWLLLNADALAEITLLSVIKYVEPQLLDKDNDSRADIMVVTYLTTNTKVRSLPYYPYLILVGLPFASGYFQKGDLKELFYEPKAFHQTDDPILDSDELPLEATIPWELLLLPHEIGHYLYWNGCLPNTQDRLEDVIKGKLRTLATSDWRLHWLEELFCDVFNCLVLGPLGILGLQATIADANPATLFVDNGAHPTPGIRPFIATRMLERAYPNQFPNATKQLDEQWQSYLDSVGQGTVGTIDIGGQSHTAASGGWLEHAHRDQGATKLDPLKAVSLSLANLLDELNPVIDAILETVKLEPPYPSQFDSFPLAPDIEASGSLQDYGTLLDSLTHGDIDEPSPAPRPFINYAQTDTFAEIKNLSDDELVKHLKRNFLNVWGDKGPEGGPIITR